MSDFFATINTIVSPEILVSDANAPEPAKWANGNKWIPLPPGKVIMPDGTSATWYSIHDGDSPYYINSASNTNPNTVYNGVHPGKVPGSFGGRLLGVDARETQHDPKKPADQFANRQWQYNSDLHDAIIDGQYTIKLENQGKDGTGSGRDLILENIVDKKNGKILGDTSSLMLKNGITKSLAFPTNVNVHTKSFQEFRKDEDEAQGVNRGIFDPSIRAIWMKEEIAESTTTSPKRVGTHNKKYGQRSGREKAIGAQEYKIGDVYLQVNPSSLSISQVRTSYAVPLLGYESKPTSSSTARTIIKLQCIFPDAVIAGDLQRILLQFKYCPINLIQSPDLFEKLASESKGNDKFMSILQRDYSGTSMVPVTMDEWTIYTMDGHPGAIGAMFQFSLFNYTAYFNDSPLDRVEYFKFTKPKTDKEQRDLIWGKSVDVKYIQKHDPRLADLIAKKSVSVPDNSGVLYRDKTIHLEDAIHPYNFNIEDDMAITASILKSLHYGKENSHLRLWKVSAAKTDKQASGIREPESPTSYTKKMPESLIEEKLVKSISIKFENIFGWLPIVGYSQPLAQYIGPGATHVSINFHTENPGSISKLLKTYNEIAEKDELFGIYDDRYIVSTFLTIFAGTELCSLRDISINTIPSHPGVSDVNVMFQKNEYAVDAKELNPAAQFDEYWGLQRIFKPLQNEAYSKLVAELLKSRNTVVPGGDLLASTNKKNVYIDGVRKSTREALNLVFARLRKISEWPASHIDEKTKKTVNNFPDGLSRTGETLFNRIELTSATPDNKGIQGSLIAIMVSYIDSKIDRSKGSISSDYFDLEALFKSASLAKDVATIQLRKDLLYLADSAKGVSFKKWPMDKMLEFIDLKSPLLIKDAFDQMAVFFMDYNKFWRRETYMMASGRNITFSFSGYPVEAKILEEVLSAGMSEDNKKTQNRETFEKYKAHWTKEEKENFPAFGVAYTPNTGLATDSICQFTFSMSYLHLLGRGVAQTDTMPDIEAIQKTAKSIADKINALGIDSLCLSKPFAGHRYYPQVESFIAPDALFSMSVGEWFADSQILNLDGLLNRIGNIVQDIKSPISDTPAWKAAFKKWQLSKNPDSEFEKMINDSGPLGVLQAVAYPDLKRDLSLAGDGAGQRPLIKGMVDTVINVVPGAWKADQDAVRSGKPANEKDQPPSTMSQLFFAKDYFGIAPKIAAQQKEFMDSVIQPKMYLNRSVMTATMIDSIHGNLGKSCVILPGKTMIGAGESSLSQITNGMIENTDNINAPINKTLKYEGAWIINSANIAQQKDPEAGDRAYTSSYASKGDTGFSGYYSDTVVALASKPKPQIVFNTSTAPDGKKSFDNAIVGEVNIDSTGPRNPVPVKPKDFENDFMGFKHFIKSWSGDPKAIAATHDKILAYTQYKKELADTLNSNVKVDTPTADLFLAMQLDSVYGGVSKSTRWQLGQKYLMSQLPTSGMQNAFPTYKMYVIKSDTSDYKFYSLDDYYDFRLVQDIMVIRDRNNPVHLLKARILIDPRYITISDVVRQKYLHDNDIQSGQSEPASNIQKVDTKDETLWSMGRVPMRVGMRICLKLGYHSDPRQLDTVFIGTITSLNGNMNSGIYDIECHGDGRELTVPAASGNKEMYGLNFSEIIAAILKSNPNVVHFGKVYGTFLERFSKEHYVLMAMGKAAINGGLLSPATLIGGGIGLGCISPMLGAGMIARGLAGATLAGGTALIPFSSTWNTALQDGHLTKKMWAENSGWWDSRMGELKQWYNGALYDSGKSSRQIAAHLYETYELNNDPIDDNIFAVDAYATLFRGRSLRVNNQRSIWSVLQDIKRLYPNYALDVRPYGNRSTIFLGPSEFDYWRTDDPLVSMAPQLLDISNRKLKYDDRAREAMTMRIERNTHGDLDPESAIGKNGIAPLIPFQKQHIVTSFSDIIMNGIRATPERGWNEVVLEYGKNANENNSDPDSIVMKANQNIEPGSTKRQYLKADWITDAGTARQYAAGVLKEGVEKMYGGTLVVRGNPKIEPHDRVYVCDKVNKMYGWVEVETVIHKFDQQSGFTTHIVPNMVCSINSDAYKSSGHIVRQLLNDKLGEITGAGVVSFLAGVVAGGSIMTALAGAMPFIVGIGGPALMIWLLSQSAEDSFKKSMDLFDGFSVKNDEEYVTTIMEAATKTLLVENSFYGGYALQMLVKAIRYVKNADVHAAVATAYDYAAIYAKSGVTKAQNASTNLVNRSSKGLIEALATKMNTTFAKLANPATTSAEIEALLVQLENSGDDGAKVAKGFRDKFAKKGGLDLILKEARAAETLVAEREAISLAAKEARMSKVNLREVDYKSVKLKAGSLIKNGFFLAMLGFIEAIPTLVESFCINAMTNTNTIVLHPLWVKNSLLLTGMEGYRTTSAFMHMKDTIMFAKKTFFDATGALADWAPVTYGSAAPVIESSTGIAHGSIKNWKTDVGAPDIINHDVTSEEKIAIKEKIKKAARDAGLSPKDEENLLTMASLESSFNPNAVSSSLATGIYQFTKRTGKGYGLFPDGVDRRRDITLNINAGIKYYIDNKAVLKGEGIDPNGLNLFITHNLGATGGPTALKAIRDGKAVTHAATLEAIRPNNGGSDDVVSYYRNISSTWEKNRRLIISEEKKKA